MMAQRQAEKLPPDEDGTLGSKIQIRKKPDASNIGLFSKFFSWLAPKRAARMKRHSRLSFYAAPAIQNNPPCP
jgi:hypothetical protein